MRRSVKHFELIAEGVNVAPLVEEIDAHPELWGANGWRKDLPVHKEMDDIWIRYAEHEEDFRRPHFPVWYPAYYKLTKVRPLLFASMTIMDGTHLGGVLITRIPPKGNIPAHADTEWHPMFYNCKLYFVLKTNPECIFRVEDERVSMKVGEVWRIDNTVEHDIINDGDTERMTLIACLKQEN